MPNITSVIRLTVAIALFAGAASADRGFPVGPKPALWELILTFQRQTTRVTPNLCIAPSKSIPLVCHSQVKAGDVTAFVPRYAIRNPSDFGRLMPSTATKETICNVSR